MRSGFSFNFDGTRKGLAAKLPEQKANPENGDQSLMKPVADFIAGEIGKLPERFNGALVIASGELDRDGGRVVAQIQIIGKEMHL